MPFRNSSHTYGAVSITLHWLGALAAVMMLSSGLMMATASGREVYLPWVKFHSSVGMLVLLLLAARIVWHFAARQPAKLSDGRMMNRVASVVHTGLLLMIGMQLITGPLDVWTGGFPLRVFDWLVVPSPIGGALKDQHDIIGEVHGYIGLAIGVLVTLHILAVFKHLLVDDDDTLARMIGMVEEPAASDDPPLEGRIGQEHPSD